MYCETIEIEDLISYMPTNIFGNENMSLVCVNSLVLRGRVL